MYLANYAHRHTPTPTPNAANRHDQPKAAFTAKSVKRAAEYQHAARRPPPTANARKMLLASSVGDTTLKIALKGAADAPPTPPQLRQPTHQLTPSHSRAMLPPPCSSNSAATVLVPRRHARDAAAAPEWHAPWKLMRVISGHNGWVRCVAVDPTNDWFVTGSADRTLKVWDLASGELRLTLTGHVSTIRGVCVSSRSPYLFSAGEDKMVRCWDLEYNKVIRDYHGHLSGVWSLALHPTLDLLVSGGRDGSARVWDIRTRAAVHTLVGHTQTVASIACQAAEPQVITGSMDSTIRCWDLVAGRARIVLTNHKKPVRALVTHPTEYTFLSAGSDNLKKWLCPDGNFLHNIDGRGAIVNTLALNADNVLAGGGDAGELLLWDWKTGHNFCRLDTVAQPGSLESERGIYAAAFDRSGSRLLTCEADKSIKVWCEDAAATPETHPVDWRPSRDAKRY